jgi:long-chain fatty acid transport protein
VGPDLLVLFMSAFVASTILPMSSEVVLGALAIGSATDVWLLDGGQDGRLNVDDDDVGVGGMAGVMLEPWPGTRFGVTYVSPVKLEFKNVVSTSNVGPTLEAALQATDLLGRNVDVDITVPQQVMLSAFHQLTDSWAVMGNLVWQDWSEFGQPEIDVASVASIQADLDYDDTWGFALGVQHAFAERWLWSLGGGYDTSPISKSDRTRACPWTASSASAPAFSTASTKTLLLVPPTNT